MPPPKKSNSTSAASYAHPQAEALIRPEVGVQPRFKKRKPPTRYAYDPSLAPVLDWDAQNPARERGEALIARIQELAAALAGAAGEDERQPLLAELQQASQQLQALSRPFLNWAGKAEHLSFEVPTLPLFIHERHSTEAILESLKGYQAGGQMALDFHGHPDRDLSEQLLKSYEHPNGWFNRMILGDSLVVMNSLLEYEHLGGQVQMIYIDPPYGVKFGSNFQPFVRKRDVSHGADDDLTREPEMVKAYRDTWELGLHSYLTYLRDRLLLARRLLTDSGSVFVQISDENLHHVREVMDEVFGVENAISLVAFKKTGFASSDALSTTHDYLVWYAKTKPVAKINPVFGERPLSPDELSFYDQIELPNGARRPLTKDEKRLGPAVRSLGRVFARNPMVSPGWQDSLGFSVEFSGGNYRPPPNRHWATSESGVENLRAANRLAVKGNTLRYVRYFDDFALQPLGTVWNDTGVGGFVGDERLYVVQTDTRVIERCMLMTSDPGDLVLDPTCGSGTTAHVAEQWGRRWITIDTSRVPLALARQRLLTAVFDYPELKNPALGPAGGFVYKMKQNRKGEQVGGVVPHVTLKSIANGEAPDVEVLVDRPELVPGITRVTGPFVVEATIPTAQGFDEAPEGGSEKTPEEDGEAFVDRMLGVLQASPLLYLAGGKQVRLAQVRRPARSLWLSAEALRLGDGLDAALAQADADNGALPLHAGEAVAIVFGPAHGSVTRRLVEEAWGEAQLPGRGYKHLYVIGFAIEPEARERIDSYYPKLGLPVTYVQATPDVLMGDLLKNLRSSQIFSVCGQPEIELQAVPMPENGLPNAQYWQVKLLGLDVFDPSTDRIEPTPGHKVPAWFLDPDYNGLVFRPRQVFFPATGAWDNLKRALKAEFDDSLWAHLAGDLSEPFVGGVNEQIAVKVIDHRGNELMVVRALKAPKPGKR